MNNLQLIAIVLLLSSICTAAYVTGEIFTNNLEKMNRTVVSIEGPFSYQLVTDKANYSIFLPEGEYRISASNFNENGDLILYAEESVRVGSQDQEIDLVLNPPRSDLLILFGGTLILIAVFLWSNHFWHGKKKRRYRLDADAQNVLKALDSFEGRSTQKELRQTLKFSDAKLSLILTELEQLGRIKKFKRGRANIVKKI